MPHLGVSPFFPFSLSSSAAFFPPSSTCSFRPPSPPPTFAARCTALLLSQGKGFFGTLVLVEISSPLGEGEWRQWLYATPRLLLDLKIIQHIYLSIYLSIYL